MLNEIRVNKEFFSAKDTLECGQIFRFFQIEDGYLVLSADKACIVKEQANETVIICEEQDKEYFYNYFDLATDYQGIFNRAQSSKYEILKKASYLGKGVRILRQNSEEMVVSFLISQNNNIPRIKKAVNLICERLGERREFCGHTYYTFPTSIKLAQQTEEFYKEVGLGYRASYMLNVSAELADGLILKIKDLNEEQLKKRLIEIKVIGEKVADCVCLFGLYKTRSFPVDVWIEKIYREDFSGTLTNRSKITAFFIDEFSFDAGYFQQYLFYYKRSLEKITK